MKWLFVVLFSLVCVASGQDAADDDDGQGIDDSECYMLEIYECDED